MLIIISLVYVFLCFAEGKMERKGSQILIADISWIGRGKEVEGQPITEKTEV